MRRGRIGELGGRASGDGANSNAYASKTFIIATEWALVHRLKQMHPDKEFIVADGCIGCRLHCPYMKMTDLRAVKRSLEENVFEVDVHEDDMEGARLSLERMLAVPRDA